MTRKHVEQYTQDRRILLIRPTRGWRSLDLRELWEYRELLFFLIWRDVKVRYKQTVLGALWAIIQPVFTMIVFSIIFGTLAKVPSDGIPYPIFSYTALVPWTLFANSLSRSTGSLVGSYNLVKRIYFPRLVIPIASVVAGLVDFTIAFVVLIGLMIYYGIAPTSGIIFLPAFVLLALVSSLGTGLWLSSLNVQFRDVGYAVPFLIRLWMYATPVVYSSTLIPERWRLIIALNPMAGVIEGFRWALLGTGTAPGPMLAISSAVAVVLLVTGAFWFRRLERTFADVM